MLEEVSGEFEGIKFSYTDMSDGPPLILIPGTLGDSNLFSFIQHNLIDKYRIIVFDHLTDKSVDKLVDNFHILFTKMLELDSFHLGGTSVGGWIAQHYAMKYPDVVKSLIIGNSFADNSILREKNMRLYKISKFIPWFVIRNFFIGNTKKTLERFDPSITEYFVSSVRSMGKRILRRRVSWSLAELPKLRIIDSIRILIIYTNDDSVVMKDTTDLLLNYYHDVKVSILRTGDHYPYRTRPDEYSKALSIFLDDVNN